MELKELIEAKPIPDDWCRECSGTGWLFFKCGTPWMCKCNPARNRLRSSVLTLEQQP